MINIISKLYQILAAIGIAFAVAFGVYTKGKSDQKAKQAKKSLDNIKKAKNVKKKIVNLDKSSIDKLVHKWTK